MLGQDLTPQLRFDRIEDNQTRLRVVRDGVWTDLIDIPINNIFYVLEVTPDSRFALAISARGRSTAALVRVNLTDCSEQIIHAKADKDLSDLINFNRFDGVIDMILLHFGDQAPIGLSKAGKTLASLISEQGQPVSIDNLSWARNRGIVTAALSLDAKGYSYYLFDLTASTTTKLGDFYFQQKHGDRLVTKDAVYITAHDGMQLNALVLRPKGVDGSVPMVVEVHGGPAHHVEWEYNHFRQFLVNRNYSVLALNFRGSDGLGKAYQAAGFGEYDRKMQDDMVDTTN